MKYYFILPIFILFSLQGYSQSKNTISLVYGVAANDVAIWGVIGDFGYEAKTGTVYGLKYERSFTKHLSLETGLTYSNDKVEENSIIGGVGTIYHYGDIKMISVPAIAKLSFLKYLYADMGFTIDFQTDYTSNSPAPDQSGIGIEAGVGGKYNFGPVMLFVNPYLQQHKIIRFNQGQNFNLMDSGIKFGVGYNF